MAITMYATPIHFYYQGSRLSLSFNGAWSASICGAHTTLQDLQAAALRVHQMAFHLSCKGVALHFENTATKSYYLYNQADTVYLFFTD